MALRRPAPYPRRRPGEAGRAETVLVFEDPPHPVHGLESDLAAQGIRAEFPGTLPARSVLPLALLAHHDTAGGLVLTGVHDRALLDEAAAAELLVQSALLLRELSLGADEFTTVAQVLKLLDGRAVPPWPTPAHELHRPHRPGHRPHSPSRWPNSRPDGPRCRPGAAGCPLLGPMAPTAGPTTPAGLPPPPLTRQAQLPVQQARLLRLPGRPTLSRDRPPRRPALPPRLPALPPRPGCLLPRLAPPTQLPVRQALLLRLPSLPPLTRSAQLPAWRAPLPLPGRPPPSWG